MNLLIPVGIGLAAFAHVMIGWLWYSPMLFGKRYMALTKAQPNPDAIAKAIAGSFLAALIMAAIMVCFMYRLNITTLSSAFHFGWMSWLGFMATVTLQGVLYAQWPLELYLINNGYNLTGAVAMALILVNFF